jgi:hypothetical protein
MLRDNPVGLIRADEAAREDSYSISLALLSFIPPYNSPRENIGRKDPTCLKMPCENALVIFGGRKRQPPPPRKFTDSAG